MAAPATNRMSYVVPVGAHYQFGGWVGERIQANIDQWLLPTPHANPGMIGMFHVRDRQPVPKLVPWAGEFVGKYLISAIQALRMSDDPRLRKTVADVVAQLVASQAADGYLGPFPHQERLTGHWDLWGHYHCLLGLLMWHEASGDEPALRAASRVGDLVCRIYLDGNKRMLEAGSDEMNLAIIHGLGRLYRVTHEPRYLAMMHEIVKDWERAGDYLRSGLNGVEFFQSPRPRWESLHNLQGLTEMFLLTGDDRYRRAFEQQWRSIARWDIRNTGGFSSGEQATGNPYAPTPIETCCTIAWMALSLDMLGLTGDARVADMIELATYNGWAGAQHPSGRWCTYSTPMDGAREASAHSIVFQARAGTPELNCCSVNGPRGWGMLSEWAVLSAPEGWVINYYGPFQVALPAPDGARLGIQCTGNYPISSSAKLTVDVESPRKFTLRLRIPLWAKGARVAVNGQAVDNVHPGTYLPIARNWLKGDVVDLDFPQDLRAVAGDREARGHISIYRGPLLLAWDQVHHDYDEASIPALDASTLSGSRIGLIPASSLATKPLVLVEIPNAAGRSVRLCDFASAGSTGSRYRSWLPAQAVVPPPIVTRYPRDGMTIPAGKSVFSWRPITKRDTNNLTYEVVVSDREDFSSRVTGGGPVTEPRLILDLGSDRNPNQWLYWKVLTRNATGSSDSIQPAARFRVDPALRVVPSAVLDLPSMGPKGELVVAPFAGSPQPRYGRLLAAPDNGWIAAPGRNDEAHGAVELDGKGQRVRFAVTDWPEENYSVSLWFRVTALPQGRLGQLFSAWAAPSDDPLRLTVDGGKLYARLEAGKAYSTPGTQIQADRWYHVAAVKAGTRLTLYVDGREAGTTDVPEFVTTSARDFALGGNPHFQGNEFLAVRVSDLAFVGRALRPDEVPTLRQP